MALRLNQVVGHGRDFSVKRFRGYRHYTGMELAIGFTGLEKTGLQVGVDRSVDR